MGALFAETHAVTCSQKRRVGVFLSCSEEFLPYVFDFGEERGRQRVGPFCRNSCFRFLSKSPRRVISVLLRGLPAVSFRFWRREGLAMERSFCQNSCFSCLFAKTAASRYFCLVARNSRCKFLILETRVGGNGETFLPITAESQIGDRGPRVKTFGGRRGSAS